MPTNAIHGAFFRGPTYSYKRKFQDQKFLSQYGIDTDMQRTIAGALDKDTELELQKMIEDLHKKARSYDR
ncbi:hypothetical protein JHW43_006525 [Diplocarpon mali]|nr:hypothetical protein JHW43_006525 [Diplocarpon mali]